MRARPTGDPLVSAVAEAAAIHANDWTLVSLVVSSEALRFVVDEQEVSVKVLPMARQMKERPTERTSAECPLRARSATGISSAGGLC